MKIRKAVLVFTLPISLLGLGLAISGGWLFGWKVWVSAIVFFYLLTGVGMYLQ
jgi:hypothetical protein